MYDSTATSRETKDRLSCVKMITHNRSMHPFSFTSIATLTCRHERRADQVTEPLSTTYSLPVSSFCFTTSLSCSFSTFFLFCILLFLYSFPSFFLSYLSFLHLYLTLFAPSRFSHGFFYFPLPFFFCISLRQFCLYLPLFAYIRTVSFSSSHFFFVVLFLLFLFSTFFSHVCYENRIEDYSIYSLRRSLTSTNLFIAINRF